MSIVPGAAHLGRRSVAEAGVRSLVVAVDVLGDLLSRLFERLEFGAPDEPLLQLPEPAFDEGLRFGIAVAATPMRDAVLGEPGAEATAGEGRAVVGTECQRARLDAADGHGAVDERRRFFRAAAQLERALGRKTYELEIAGELSRGWE